MDGNLAILVDAKTEYTNQLVQILAPNIFKSIKQIYDDIKLFCKSNGLIDVLHQFQIKLSNIPQWNQEIINKEYNKLVDLSRCDWLEELLIAVFISHTRILSSINNNKNKNKINLKVPKVDHFIHLCFIEVARAFWKNPYLFDDNISKYEYQRNRRDAENIIEKTITETIRKQLPVKHILKDYLGNDFNDDQTTDITSNNSTDNLRKMVKNEIQNCSNEKLSKLNINLNENLDIESKDQEYISSESNPPKEPTDSYILKQSTLENEPNPESVLESESKQLLIKPIPEPEPLPDPVSVPKYEHEPVSEPVNSVSLEVKEDKPNITMLVEDNDDILNVEKLDLKLDDDLSKMQEIYVDDNNEESNLHTKNIIISEPKIKKQTFAETDLEINYDSDSDKETNYKQRKYSNKLNFFNN